MKELKTLLKQIKNEGGERLMIDIAADHVEQNGLFKELEALHKKLSRIYDRLYGQIEDAHVFPSYEGSSPELRKVVRAHNALWKELYPIKAVLSTIVEREGGVDTYWF